MNTLEPSMDPALRAALRERLTHEFSRSARAPVVDGAVAARLARLRTIVREAVARQGQLQLSLGPQSLAGRS